MNDGANSATAERGRQQRAGARDPLSDINRSLPFSDDAEKGVLSCFLQNPAVLLDDAAATLPPGAFYHPVNQDLYVELLGMNGRNKPIDLVTVSQHLIDRGLIDKLRPAFLEDLLCFVPTAAHYPYYKGILRDKWLLREVIGACTEGIQACYTYQDAEEGQANALSIVEERLLAVRMAHDANRDGGPRPLDAVLSEVLAEIKRRQEKQGQILGIRTGIPDLDRTINGLEPPDVFFIMARPGMGKTNLMIYIMIHLAVTLVEDRVPAFCLSLEMSSVQLIRRALLSEARVEQSKGRTGFLSEKRVHGADSDEAKIERTAERFRSGTLWLDDTAELTISEVRARIRQMKRKHDIRVVMIDYAQIILPVTKKGLAEERLGIAEVCSGLKAVAKQCGLVIIVLAQAGRGSEDNPGAKPRLRDMDGSSAMEKWADFVGAIHRPSKYKAWAALNEKQQEYYADEQTYLEAVELLLLKGRECGEAVIPLRFIHKLARFEPTTKKLYSNNPDERQHTAPDDEEMPF